jgi:hypothetical protein
MSETAKPQPETTPNEDQGTANAPLEEIGRPGPASGEDFDEFEEDDDFDLQDLEDNIDKLNTMEADYSGEDTNFKQVFLWEVVPILRNIAGHVQANQDELEELQASILLIAQEQGNLKRRVTGTSGGGNESARVDRGISVVSEVFNWLNTRIAIHGSLESTIKKEAFELMARCFGFIQDIPDEAAMQQIVEAAQNAEQG